MIGFRGLTIAAGDPMGAAVTAGRLGNVVLFERDPGSAVRNVEGPAQVAALNAALQALAPTPLIISTDQEGGRVARLDPRHGFPATVSAGQLGDQDDVELTALEAGAMAATLSRRRASTSTWRRWWTST